MKKQNNVGWLKGKLIGRGSFGCVNLAYDTRTRSVFAVKSVDINSTHQLVSLEKEIEILRTISSPYIVRYIGDDLSCDPATSTTYRNLHLEYLPHGAITNHIDAGTLRLYTWCLVSALDYLHKNGIVHCDVKGRNVLAGPTPGSAKLADFGSAMKIATNGESGKLMARGSPMWMAPEVVRGEYQGPESDVWSLACTVIEIASNGKCEWWGRDGENFNFLGSDALPEIPTCLSALGRDFLDKCLRRNPKDRWSCDQLLQHPFLSCCDREFNVGNANYDSSSFWIGSDSELSPHCVLDSRWSSYSSGFGEIDNGNEGSSCSGQATISFGANEAAAKGRVNKLAGIREATWHSEGWVTVRSLDDEHKQENGAEEIRTNLVHVDSDTRAEQEILKIRIPDPEEGVVGFTVVQLIQSFLLLYMLKLAVILTILINKFFIFQIKQLFCSLGSNFEFNSQSIFFYFYSAVTQKNSCLTRLPKHLRLLIPISTQTS